MECFFFFWYRDWLNSLILKSRDGQMEKKETCEHCFPHCNIYLVQTVVGSQFPSQTLLHLPVSRKHTGRQPFVSIQIKYNKEVLQSGRNTFVRSSLIFLRKLGISTIPKSASGEDRYYSFMGTGNWFSIYVAILIFFLHQCKYAAVEDVFWLSYPYQFSRSLTSKKKGINFTASVVSRIFFDEHSIRSKLIQYFLEKLM